MSPHDRSLEDVGAEGGVLVVRKELSEFFGSFMGLVKTLEILVFEKIDCFDIVDVITASKRVRERVVELGWVYLEGKIYKFMNIYKF